MTPAAAIQRYCSAHGRGCAACTRAYKTGAVAIDFQPRRFANDADAGTAVAAIGMKGRLRIHGRPHQLAAQPRTGVLPCARFRVHCMHRCVSVALICVLRGWGKCLCAKVIDRTFPWHPAVRRKQKAPFTKVGAFLVSGLGGSRDFAAVVRSQATSSVDLEKPQATNLDRARECLVALQQPAPATYASARRNAPAIAARRYRPHPATAGHDRAVWWRSRSASAGHDRIVFWRRYRSALRRACQI